MAEIEIDSPVFFAEAQVKTDDKILKIIPQPPPLERPKLLFSPSESPTGLDAYPADKLTDDAGTPEFFKLLETGFMVKIFLFFFNGRGGTARETSPALSAISLYGFIRLERHICKDGDQPESRPVIRVDKEVVSSCPA